MIPNPKSKDVKTNLCRSTNLMTLKPKISFLIVCYWISQTLLDEFGFYLDNLEACFPVEIRHLEPENIPEIYPISHNRNCVHAPKIVWIRKVTHTIIIEKMVCTLRENQCNQPLVVLHKSFQYTININK